MKVVDLQPRQVVAILEIPLDELRDIVDSLDGVPVNEKGSGALKDFCAMVDKLIEEFDHGTTSDR
jgi:hypothetical protein